MRLLSKLLYPESVAVIGASRSPGKVGHDILSNLIKAGFGGKILPVNPSAEQILGLNCLKKLKGSGEKIDLAVVAVPRDLARAAVEDALAAGAGAVVVITAGFKEMDEEGAGVERELASLCHSHQARMLGPNCLGLINSHHKLNASFAGRMPSPGNISVISQSGALATAILDLAAGRHLGLAKLVSIGNKGDISEVDLAYRHG